MLTSTFIRASICSRSMAATEPMLGYASAITILSTPDHGQNASDHVQKSPENPK